MYSGSCFFAAACLPACQLDCLLPKAEWRTKLNGAFVVMPVKILR